MTMPPPAWLVNEPAIRAALAADIAAYLAFDQRRQSCGGLLKFVCTKNLF